MVFYYDNKEKKRRMDGLVIENTGSFYKVKNTQGLFTCKIKGAFKIKGIRTTNPIAVGDNVSFELPDETNTNEIGWITEIKPRRNYIIRRSSNLSKQAHIIGANIDRALLIVTVNYPITSLTFIDRFLATSEAYSIPVEIVFNKIDKYTSAEMSQVKDLTTLYESIGYPCHAISATTGEGIESLSAIIASGITLLSGHSGVGKSTLINTLVPSATLKTKDISKAHHTGMHTTTYSSMIERGEAYLIDTPGVKGFGTIEFNPKEVGHFFPEIFRASSACRFSNCTHTREPGCNVIQAVSEGEIAESRYKSYLSIISDNKEDKYRSGY